MARKTKAELKAEHVAHAAALKAAEMEAYPKNLMDMLVRACALGYDLTAAEDKFVVKDWASGGNWKMDPLYTEESAEQLDTLTWNVEEEELRRVAEAAKAQAKAAALAKLSKEERELLGL